MRKIKILEVNNIDLPGRRFNGYDMLNWFNDSSNLDIKQVVIIKQSDNDKVIKLFPNSYIDGFFYKLQDYEQSNLSLNNIYSISSSALKDLNEYKEADIIHFHMFHNSKLSLYSLIDISKEKKVVITLHDPWFLTGRCVHFYDCDKWKTGCKKCKKLENLFPFKIDNCNEMWKLKSNIFNNIDVSLIVTSEWMKNLVKKSPFLKDKKLYKIPLGLDLDKFKSSSKDKARKKFNIAKNDIVLFTRAQMEFKGAKYILEALKKLKTDENITLITCDQKDLFDEIKSKINIIDLGLIQDEKIIQAFSACDIFLMPSSGESFGMMALEAMSCERPVIVFDNTALPNVTYAPECGYLVKNKSSEDLKKAIKHLIENPDERKKRAKLGRKICLEFYDIKKYNNSILKMYNEIYITKRKTKTIKKETLDNNLIKQLNYEFNKIIIYLFGDSSEAFRFLFYSESFDNHLEIDYSNLEVQKKVEEFNNKLYKYLINKNKFSIKYKLKDFIKKHPKIYKLIKLTLTR